MAGWHLDAPRRGKLNNVSRSKWGVPLEPVPFAGPCVEVVVAVALSRPPVCNGVYSPLFTT